MLSLLPRLLFRLLTECVLKTEKGRRRRKKEEQTREGSRKRCYRKRKGSSTSSKRGKNVKGREKESQQEGREKLSKEGKKERKGKGRWWMNVLQDISNTKVLSSLSSLHPFIHPFIHSCISRAVLTPLTTDHLILMVVT